MRPFPHSVASSLAAIAFLIGASNASAYCGCDKPPPPRANVRPFAAYVDQTIQLFDDRLVPGDRYTVRFTARDGSSDWSRGRVVTKPDFADGEMRPQLRVSVPSVALGPSEISVFDRNDQFVYTLSDDEFTVISRPIALHDFAETISRDGYQAGVGADGTAYFAFDMTDMSNATTYMATAEGVALHFKPEGVAIYNSQGIYGGGLDPTAPGLFKFRSGGAASDTLSYWRHEFRTYKEDHRKRDARRSSDGEWHADGTLHVDNYHLVVAVSGMTVGDGTPLAPGATPPFRLVITSTPAASSDL